LARCTQAYACEQELSPASPTTPASFKTAGSPARSAVSDCRTAEREQLGDDEQARTSASQPRMSWYDRIAGFWRHPEQSPRHIDNVVSSSSSSGGSDDDDDDDASAAVELDFSRSKVRELCEPHGKERHLLQRAQGKPESLPKEQQQSRGPRPLTQPPLTQTQQVWAALKTWLRPPSTSKMTAPVKKAADKPKDATGAWRRIAQTKPHIANPDRARMIEQPRARGPKWRPTGRTTINDIVARTQSSAEARAMFKKQTQAPRATLIEQERHYREAVHQTWLLPLEARCKQFTRMIVIMQRKCDVQSEEISLRFARVSQFATAMKELRRRARELPRMPSASPQPRYATKLPRASASPSPRQPSVRRTTREESVTSGARITIAQPQTQQWDAPWRASSLATVTEPQARPTLGATRLGGPMINTIAQPQTFQQAQEAAFRTSGRVSAMPERQTLPAARHGGPMIGGQQAAAQSQEATRLSTVQPIAPWRQSGNTTTAALGDWQHWKGEPSLPPRTSIAAQPAKETRQTTHRPSQDARPTVAQAPQQNINTTIAALGDWKQWKAEPQQPQRASAAAQPALDVSRASTTRPTVAQAVLRQSSSAAPLDAKLRTNAPQQLATRPGPDYSTPARMTMPRWSGIEGNVVYAAGVGDDEGGRSRRLRNTKQFEATVRAARTRRDDVVNEAGAYVEQRQETPLAEAPRALLAAMTPEAASRTPEALAKTPSPRTKTPSPRAKTPSPRTKTPSPRAKTPSPARQAATAASPLRAATASPPLLLACSPRRPAAPTATPVRASPWLTATRPVAAQLGQPSPQRRTLNASRGPDAPRIFGAGTQRGRATTGLTQVRPRSQRRSPSRSSSDSDADDQQPELTGETAISGPQRRRHTTMVELSAGAVSPEHLVKLWEKTRRERGWKWSTTSTFLGALLGAMKSSWLGDKARVAERIRPFVASRRFKEYVSSVQKKTISETVNFPTPAKIAQVLAMGRAAAASTRARAAILLAWVFAGRTADILKLQTSRIVLKAPRTTGLTAADSKATIMAQFVEGKGVSARKQAFTIAAYVPAELLSLLREFLESRMGSKYLFSPQTRKQVENEMRKLLRPRGLELRSMRRGALQTMASAGAPATTLRYFSHHSNDETLERYLSWGWYRTERHVATLGASRFLLGAPSSGPQSAAMTTTTTRTDAVELQEETPKRKTASGSQAF